MLAKIVSKNIRDVTMIIKYGRLYKLQLGVTTELCKFMLQSDPYLSDDINLEILKELINNKIILRNEQNLPQIVQQKEQKEEPAKELKEEKKDDRKLSSIIAKAQAVFEAKLKAKT